MFFGPVPQLRSIVPRLDRVAKRGPGRVVLRTSIGGQVKNKEDFLEKGFQLAYFIFPSRSLAIRILTGALNKLKAQRGREHRRTYWRDKYLKRGITRITREEADTLQ